MGDKSRRKLSVSALVALAVGLAAPAAAAPVSLSSLAPPSLATPPAVSSSLAASVETPSPSSGVSASDPDLARPYFGARYYGSKIGRFTTVDPVYTWQENLVDPQRWNRYAYVRNNPLRHTDPDGRAITPETIWDVASLSMSIQAARDDPGNVWNWIAAGADALAVAAPLAPAVGIAIRGAGKVDDVIDAGRGASNIVDGSKAGKIGSPGGPKLGSEGGPGAGKRFSEKTKDAARAENPSCVFCDRPTTREPGPTQSNIDHSKAKSRRGNSTAENAQNTCRDCNLRKGARSTEEFVRQ